MDTLPPRLKPSVALIIPAWNESAAIGHVVRRVPRHIVDEIIVVDAGSTDSTVEEAEGAGARTVIEPRRGYGRACATGVNSTCADIIAFIDGDGSDDTSELESVIRPLLDNQAGLVLGARCEAEGGAMPIYARIGNVIAAGLISTIWRQRVTDLPSCKAIRRDDLVSLGMSEASYGWTIEMIVKAARRGLVLKEVQLTYRARMGGESKVSGNPRASIKAAYAILRVLLRHSLSRGGAGRNGPIELLSPPTRA